VKYGALLAVLTAFAGAQAFAVAENLPDSQALYWALTTMTTVGYGDVTPKTGTGQIIAVTVMLVGFGFVAVLTGAIAQRFIAPAEAEATMDRRELHDRLEALATRLERIEAAVLVRQPEGGGTDTR
jgi:voltage-gated potassium channel